MSIYHADQSILEWYPGYFGYRNPYRLPRRIIPNRSAGLLHLMGIVLFKQIWLPERTG